jgi:lipoate-protein ligase A
LYSWEPAAFSLGFAQPFLDVDLKLLRDRNWDLVRRPTGGRAILHVDELTYSITAPLDESTLTGNLLESYRTISRALLLALKVLGVTANGDKEYQTGMTSVMPNPVCFETPSNYEITAQGKKLIGSAQARKYGGLLQHGSLPLFGDLTRITQVLRYKDAEARQAGADKLLAHAVTLEQVLGKVIPLRTAEEAFIEGFSIEFNIQLVPSFPTEYELTLANDLMLTKYAAPEWTNRI